MYTGLRDGNNLFHSASENFEGQVSHNSFHRGPVCTRVPRGAPSIQADHVIRCQEVGFMVAKANKCNTAGHYDCCGQQHSVRGLHATSRASVWLRIGFIAILKSQHAYADLTRSCSRYFAKMTFVTN